jgi:hypothetical protein
VVRSSKDETFKALRGVLAAHSRHLVVTVDKPGDYHVASPTMRDRTGRPLFVARVQITKNYVSYHLIPAYAVPQIAKMISPGLKQRMQGKSCFNFTAIETDQLEELSALTKAGIAAFRDLKLPWNQAGEPPSSKQRKARI